MHAGAANGSWPGAALISHGGVAIFGAERHCWRISAKYKLQRCAAGDGISSWPLPSSPEESVRGTWRNQWPVGGISVHKARIILALSINMFAVC